MVSINNAAATAVITIADTTTIAGVTAANTIAVVTAPAGGLASLFLPYNLMGLSGIVITIATAAADVTVVWN
jgi:hypothetical protein